MYRTIFPTKDCTLYSRHPERNTGVDQILELVKVASGSAIEDLINSHEYWETNLNSRILIDFDISEVSKSVSDGNITNPKFYLTVKSTEAIHLPINYTIDAHPISGSWVNGTGYYNNDGEVTNGASWIYRGSKNSGLSWETHGGDYYPDTEYKCSQEFNYEHPDLRMDVSNIVNSWISGVIPQDGIILKHGDTEEVNSDELGSVKFFSKDTHTIYIPRLEIYWDDVDLSGTGSVDEITSEEYIMYIKNLRESYTENETPKLLIGVRPRFPQRTYTSSNTITLNRLPTTSYFSILDSVTDEVIVPFDSIGTAISCDDSGNYIKLDMNSFLPERFYKILIRVERESGNIVDEFDNGMYFKVRRK